MYMGRKYYNNMKLKVTVNGSHSGAISYTVVIHLGPHIEPKSTAADLLGMQT